MPRGQRKEEILRAELPPTLPLMALRSTIVYPLGTIAVQMGAPENLALLRAHEESGLVVALVVASSDNEDAIDPHHFVGRVGVAARVHERINLPGETVQITLQGLRRITIDAIDQVEPFSIARIQGARETPPDPNELDELVARTVAAAETLAELVDRIPSEVPQILKMNVSDPGRFADLAATNMNLRIADKEEVLQRLDIGQRIRFILSRLERRGVVTHTTRARQFVYRALVTEEEVQHSMVSELTAHLFEGDVPALVNHLLTAQDVTPGDLARIREMLDAANPSTETAP